MSEKVVKSNSKNGPRKITMRKVRKHGRNRTLKWKITKNEPG